MTLEEIMGKYVETTQAILICSEKKYYEAVLILLYSSIDSISWLYSKEVDIDKRGVRKEYKDWLNKFLIPNLKGYDCTAQELYLARCAVLHTYSAVAKNQGNNRIITYIYGDKEYENNIRKIVNEDETLKKENLILIHMGDLINAYCKGTNDFFGKVVTDNDLYCNVIKKAELYYRGI